MTKKYYKEETTSGKEPYHVRYFELTGQYLEQQPYALYQVTLYPSPKKSHKSKAISFVPKIKYIDIHIQFAV